MKVNIFLLVFSALAITACNDDNTTGTPATTGGTGSIETQNAFTTVNNALTSLTSAFPIATCDTTTGAPTTAAGSATFVTDKIFCSLSSATSTASSARNGYARTAGLLCAVTKASPLTNSTTPTLHENLTISETDPCFVGGGVDLNNDGDTADTVPVSYRETSGAQGDFGSKIELQTNTATFNTAGANDTTIYSKNGPDVNTAKSVSTNAVSETVIRKSTGEVFYENIDYKNSNHTRMYAKGTLGTNGTIGSVTNIQMIEASGNTGSEANSVLFGTDGKSTWMDQYVGTTRAPGFDTCTAVVAGTTPDCTALIIPYNAQFHDFTANPATNFDNGMLMTSTAPITMSF